MRTDWNFLSVMFYELFDLNTDPWQMHNIYDRQNKSYKDALRTRVAHEWYCAGATCT